MVLFMTGCWDKVEINDTAYIVGMGVDLEDDEYVISYVYPNLPVYTGQSEGSPLFIRTVSDETMAGAAKKLAAQMNKTMNFEHMEALVISTGVLSDSQKLQQLMDYLGRSSEYPRRIPVLTAVNAQETLQPDPAGSEAVGMYIHGIYANNQSVVQNYKLILQTMLTAIEKQEGLLIPVLYAKEGVYGISNALVYKEEPLGVLHMEELEALSWLKNAAEGMNYAMELDGGHVSLEIDRASCEYMYSENHGILEIKAMIKAETQVREYAAAGAGILEGDILDNLEQQAAYQIAEEAEAIVDRMQKEYKVDVISLLDPLKFQDRALYLKEIQQWESLYPQMHFHAEAEVIIEKIGIKE